jgi:hypothetical protein
MFLVVSLRRSQSLFNEIHVSLGRPDAGWRLLLHRSIIISQFRYNLSRRTTSSHCSSSRNPSRQRHGLAAQRPLVLKFRYSVGSTHYAASSSRSALRFARAAIGPAKRNPATTFGTLITSDQPIVVERALYWNVNGETWAAGTNATATRLP